MLVFRERETGVPGEKPLGAREREPATTKPTQTWRRLRDLNPGDNGG